MTREEKSATDKQATKNNVDAEEFKKEDFNEKYALRDVLDGRYKKAYKKYNIIPYKNFDYSIWNK